MADLESKAMTSREEVERVAGSLKLGAGLDTQFEAAALLRSLVAKRDEAIKHAEALSDSLRCEVERRYAGIKDHPAMRKKYELDMSEVVAFRKWMEGRK